MGLYLTVYLGPYVECTYRDETREIEVVGCTNAKCPEHVKAESWGKPSGKFCPSCASPIGKCKRTERFHRSTYDALGESEELTALTFDSKDRTVCLGSNIKGPRDFHPEVECHVDLSTINQSAEVQWFKDRFARDLAKLETAYDDVTLKWGLHMYER